MKSEKLSYNIILVLFSIIVVLVLMTGCNGGAPPIVNIFSISPPTINQGESSTLTWSVSDADTVTITPDVGTVASSGSTSVSPVVPTDYILTATNSAGSVTATAAINVQALPVHNLTKNTYYNTIQAALDDADSNNTIEVADGTYDETIDFPSGKKVILQSVNGPSSTTIRGDDNSSTVNLSNSLPGTTIEGFTITHAVGLIGGGILNDVGNLAIYNCTVFGNTADTSGGGIRNYGTLTITGASTVSDNTADSSGGGIYNSGTLTITGASTVSGNTADSSGGGIFNWDTLTITGASTVSGNTAGWGGGIRNSGTLTITDASTISGNTAGQGGGIANFGGGTLKIEGASTLSGNTADTSGGGIANYGALTITDESTVYGNTADTSGGGIYINSLSTTIAASTISGNSAGQGGGIYINVVSFISTIGGSSSAKKNTICGNYKSGNSPSLDQQIRDSSGSVYGTYNNTNYIYTNCPF